MEIRRAVIVDLASMEQIYARARKFMITTGNPDQWDPSYPGRELLVKNITDGQAYVLEEKGRVHGTFAFIVGEEPTYTKICDGQWRKNETYGTVHRLASDGTVKGAGRACLTYCSDRQPYLRIDTHKNNLPMQKVIESFGFKRCGIITVRGGERIAYDYIRSENR